MFSYCACTAMLRSSGSNSWRPSFLARKPARPDASTTTPARTVCSAPSGSAYRSVTPVGVEGGVEGAMPLADGHAGLLRVTEQELVERRARHLEGLGRGRLRPLRRSRRTARWRRRSSGSSPPTSGRTRRPRSCRGRRAPGRPRWSRAAGTRRCGSGGTARAPAGGPGVRAARARWRRWSRRGRRRRRRRRSPSRPAWSWVADRMSRRAGGYGARPAIDCSYWHVPMAPSAKISCSATHWTVSSKTSFV